MLPVVPTLRQGGRLQCLEEARQCQERCGCAGSQHQQAHTQERLGFGNGNGTRTRLLHDRYPQPLDIPTVARQGSVTQSGYTTTVRALRQNEIRGLTSLESSTRDESCPQKSKAPRDCSRRAFGFRIEPVRRRGGLIHRRIPLQARRGTGRASRRADRLLPPADGWRRSSPRPLRRSAGSAGPSG